MLQFCLKIFIVLKKNYNYLLKKLNLFFKKLNFSYIYKFILFCIIIIKYKNKIFHFIVLSICILSSLISLNMYSF